MKKIYSILTIFAFALLLVACGDTTGGGGNVNPDPDPDPDPDPVEVDPTASLAGLIDIEITQGDSFDPMTGVTATDTVDGNITNRITVTGAVLTNTPGTYVLTYKVVGSDGKTVQGTRTI